MDAENRLLPRLTTQLHSSAQFPHLYVPSKHLLSDCVVVFYRVCNVVFQLTCVDVFKHRRGLGSSGRRGRGVVLLLGFLTSLLHLFARARLGGSSSMTVGVLLLSVLVTHDHVNGTAFKPIMRLWQAQVHQTPRPPLVLAPCFASYRPSRPSFYLIISMVSFVNSVLHSITAQRHLPVAFKGHILATDAKKVAPSSLRSKTLIASNYLGKCTIHASQRPNCRSAFRQREFELLAFRRRRKCPKHFRISSLASTLANWRISPINCTRIASVCHLSASTHSFRQI